MLLYGRRSSYLTFVWLRMASLMSYFILRLPVMYRHWVLASALTSDVWRNVDFLKTRDCIRVTKICHGIISLSCDWHGVLLINFKMGFWHSWQISVVSVYCIRIHLGQWSLQTGWNVCEVMFCKTALVITCGNRVGNLMRLGRLSSSSQICLAVGAFSQKLPWKIE